MASKGSRALDRVKLMSPEHSPMRSFRRHHTPGTALPPTPPHPPQHSSFSFEEEGAGDGGVAGVPTGTSSAAGTHHVSATRRLGGLQQAILRSVHRLGLEEAQFQAVSQAVRLNVWQATEDVKHADGSWGGFFVSTLLCCCCGVAALLMSLVSFRFVSFTDMGVGARECVNRWWE